MKSSKPSDAAPSRVREPVQVYLDPEDRARLERMTRDLDTSKSDVLRRGLRALERQLSDPNDHPALRIIGIAAGAPELSDPGYDPAREHDRFLAELEERSWTGEATRGKTGGATSGATGGATEGATGRVKEGPRKKTERGC